MTIFTFAVAGAILSGLLMVGGGIWLIYKGALVLASTDKATALSIEWKKSFRLNTQAPGVAFFIIGLLFLIVALQFSKPAQIEPIQVLGRVINVDQPVTVTAETDLWPIKISSDGKINGEIYPNVRQLTIRITAPGYRPVWHPITLEDDHTVELAEPIALIKTTSEIFGSVENIDEAPAGLAPLASAPNFGSTQ